MRAVVPRILVAGTASSVGKTTVACSLMRLLSRRGLRVQACKVGPDYLDPTFHGRVLGLPSRNLDLFLGDEELACALLGEGSADVDLTVIEGVMGFYDGIATSADASSYDVARATQTPVVLVVDARGRSLSVAAEVAGFISFRKPSLVAGVILNRASERHYQLLKGAIERETGVPVLGYVPRLPQAELPSRHLGLVSADEVADALQRVDAVASALAQTLDVSALVRIADGAGELAWRPRELPSCPEGRPLVAVARDDAFSFYYHDALDLLERLGARLVDVSPLRDEALPDGACGLYLGGGYPELHARELSANEAFRASVKGAIKAGMPTIAECGGFLYLQQELEDEEGTTWPMVGLLEGRSSKGPGLGRFGYVTLTAERDGLLARKGERLPAHEFHYWQSDHLGNAFQARKPQSDRGWACGVTTESLYAAFPHLYLPGVPWAAQRFVEACARWGERGGGGPS